MSMNWRKHEEKELMTGGFVSAWLANMAVNLLLEKSFEIF
jgi:hypothetical protein